MSAPAGPYILSQRKRVEHAADCFWNRAHPPVDGDEAACCSCGAYADASAPLSRWAYATLEEAIKATLSAIDRSYRWQAVLHKSGRRACSEASSLSGSGGTIELPGGEIVVEATTWGELAAVTKRDAISAVFIGHLASEGDADAQGRVLADRNAEYGIGPYTPQPTCICGSFAPRAGCPVHDGRGQGRR
jgi:hypothetical protein